VDALKRVTWNVSRADEGAVGWRLATPSGDSQRGACSIGLAGAPIGLPESALSSSWSSAVSWLSSWSSAGFSMSAVQALPGMAAELARGRKTGSS